jgi:hypothetical protein
MPKLETRVGSTSTVEVDSEYLRLWQIRGRVDGANNSSRGATMIVDYADSVPKLKRRTEMQGCVFNPLLN